MATLILRSSCPHKYIEGHYLPTCCVGYHFQNNLPSTIVLTNAWKFMTGTKTYLIALVCILFLPVSVFTLSLKKLWRDINILGSVLRSYTLDSDSSVKGIRAFGAMDSKNSENMLSHLLGEVKKQGIDQSWNMAEYGHTSAASSFKDPPLRRTLL